MGMRCGFLGGRVELLERKAVYERVDAKVPEKSLRPAVVGNAPEGKKVG
jgi:hypothetical protein